MMKKYIQLFFEALRGGEGQLYTEMSINRAIFLLSVPMILEMMGESLFAIVDAFFVSKYVGIDALAAVAITESVMMLIYSIAIGLSSAATAIVARRVGEGKPQEAGLAVAQVILISLALAALVGIPGVLYAPEILKIMGGSDTLIQSGVGFTRLIFASSPAIILLYTLSGALRGAGDASTAMRSILLANLINIALDIFFIVGMKYGVVGAAMATTIGRSIGVIYQLYALIKGNGNINIKTSQFKPNTEVIRNLLKVGAGGTGQFLIQSASWIFLMRIVATFGSSALAGYLLAIRVVMFTILPSWGMSNAAATLVGQNLGAGKADRAETSVWRTAFYNMFFLLFVAIGFYIFAQNILSIFADDSQVIAIGVSCLRIICTGYVFFAFGMVIGQSLNGAGDTLSPTLMNLVCFWLIEIPLAYLLAIYWQWGVSGVFWSIAISESILAFMAIFVFRRGRWKTVKV